MQRQKKDPHRNASLFFIIKLGSTYFPSPSPDKYFRRYVLNFRIRDGNGCFHITIATKNFLDQRSLRYSQIFHCHSFLKLL